MHQILKARILDAFRLTAELADHLAEESLAMDLSGLPSNRIGEQLWCMTGARESYTRAIREGGWQGFSCGLTEPLSKGAVLAALEASRSEFEALDFEPMTAAQLELALALLEHEVQHHGQLIRYVYGNRLTFPKSWSARYTV